MSEKKAQIPTGDPPMMVCLHCRHYTIKKRFCQKSYPKDPYRKPLTPACSLWSMSKDALFAWRATEPANSTEKWAKEKLQDMFRKAAYPRG